MEAVHGVHDALVGGFFLVTFPAGRIDMADLAILRGFRLGTGRQRELLHRFTLNAVRIAQFQTNLVRRGRLQVHDAAGKAFGVL